MTASKATELAYERRDVKKRFTPEASNAVISSSAKTESDNGRKKFALLVGINLYPGSVNLNGCINDVNDWRAILLARGWSASNVRVLRDKQATRARIIHEIRWLVSNRTVDDSLWFHFSGHGGWTLRPDGRGWECCICCTDCGKDWDAGIIARTEFTAALRRRRGRLLVFLDCCFSGGMIPSYPSRRQLTPKVRQFLLQIDRSLAEVRALQGPKWETLNAATKRLGISRREIMAQVAQRILKERRVRGGPLHVLSAALTSERMAQD